MSSYRRKPFYKNKPYNGKYRRSTGKRYFNKRNYYRSRSRNSNTNRSNDYRSKRSNNMFNMYSKYEHLSSSSPSSSSYSSSREDEFYVDREKTCPFLLKIFYKIDSYNSLNLFRDKLFPAELNIYTWEDADLEELAKFIHLALKNTILSAYDYYKFSRIYYDSKGTLLRDEIGCVVTNSRSSKLNENVNKTLKEIGFQIGDYFDINITSVNKR
jgi:hypothetical protein